MECERLQCRMPRIRADRCTAVVAPIFAWEPWRTLLRSASGVRLPEKCLQQVLLNLGNVFGGGHLQISCIGFTPRHHPWAAFVLHASRPRPRSERRAMGCHRTPCTCRSSMSSRRRRSGRVHYCIAATTTAPSATTGATMAAPLALRSLAWVQSDDESAPLEEVVPSGQL